MMDGILTDEEIATLANDTTPAQPPRPVKIAMQLIRKCMSMPHAAAPPSTDNGHDDDDDAEVASMLTKPVLRLDWQGIAKIEHLDVFCHVRDLYLQHNAIHRLENLDFHSNLEFLALSHNHITVVENISHLTKLKFLDLSHNRIAHLDVSALPSSLVVLRLAGNPWAESNDGYYLTLFKVLPRLQTVDQYRRQSNGADSPTYHGDAGRPDAGSLTTPLFTTPDTASREAIKEQKEAMSARHVDKMKQLNANLNDEKDQIVERSTRRMRERRQKLQQQTKTFMEEAASHVQALHAKHATWRRAQLEATSQAS
ncbi:hypothetical protein H257_09227 [Aphanomyces astaci]|uniref:Uncharacterized protein n=1 Tax=Aphanomyces astaci TaxID=112090 RepID=W4GAS4_APHAT|nr:hypothetical protein H257_09227 [Aphanomyces astaci]ETV76770.1 hypothetical protein H257_09227 [Aphanomyces astaci]|eukprot:XP_009833682.1 hypothetical protein H257_09227 [Aphanomyces astaci]